MPQSVRGQKNFQPNKPHRAGVGATGGTLTSGRCFGRSLGRGFGRGFGRASPIDAMYIYTGAVAVGPVQPLSHGSITIDGKKSLDHYGVRIVVSHNGHNIGRDSKCSSWELA
jgi:hypothetical protein